MRKSQCRDLQPKYAYIAVQPDVLVSGCDHFKDKYAILFQHIAAAISVRVRAKTIRINHYSFGLCCLALVIASNITSQPRHLLCNIQHTYFHPGSYDGMIKRWHDTAAVQPYLNKDALMFTWCNTLCSVTRWYVVSSLCLLCSTSQQLK